MTVQNLITGPNLGPEFLIGTGVDPAKIEIKVDGTTIDRALDGTLSAVIPPDVDQILSYSNGTQLLTLTRNDGSPDDTVDLSALAADIFVDGATFDATTGVLTLTDNDAGTPDVVVNLGLLLGVSTDAGNLLTNGADGKPNLQPADLCQAVFDNCLDDCVISDVFGNTLGTVQMAQ